MGSPSPGGGLGGEPTCLVRGLLRPDGTVESLNDRARPVSCRCLATGIPCAGPLQTWGRSKHHPTPTRRDISFGVGQNPTGRSARNQFVQGAINVAHCLDHCVLIFELRRASKLSENDRRVPGSRRHFTERCLEETPEGPRRGVVGAGGMGSLEVNGHPRLGGCRGEVCSSSFPADQAGPPQGADTWAAVDVQGPSSAVRVPSCWSAGA
jgi:hypothetical protein